ncbi:unnamed protein product [Dicrocoelium dendriticum]|nr:unnamed protein product [Dicrocoelium dendriticum]
MGDSGDFDLCECIGNHESAMRRLLGMLRQSQAFCGDSHCMNDLSPIPQSNSDPVSSTMLILCATVFAVIGIMLFARPGRNSNGKPGGSNRVSVTSCQHLTFNFCSTTYRRLWPLVLGPESDIFIHAHRFSN